MTLLPSGFFLSVHSNLPLTDEPTLEPRLSSKLACHGRTERKKPEGRLMLQTNGSTHQSCSWASAVAAFTCIAFPHEDRWLLPRPSLLIVYLRGGVWSNAVPPGAGPACLPRQRCPPHPLNSHPPQRLFCTFAIGLFAYSSHLLWPATFPVIPKSLPSTGVQ